MTAPKPGARPSPGAMPGALSGTVPGTLPGARSGPRQSGGTGAAGSTPTPTAPVTPVDPSAFGRIDGDGVVWVRTASGERRVGEWKAGSPEEGLAHFGRRFDDLAAEVSLLAARLRTHPGEARRISGDATTLRSGVTNAAVVGDLDDLDRRLANLIGEAETVAAREAALQQERRSAAAARKGELVTEVEALGRDAAADWKAAGDRLHDVLTEWKSLPRTNATDDDALWDRFRTARNGYQERRNAHFAELDRTRDRVRRVKEDLVSRAEALQDSTDWGETARRYRDLMTEWKAAGRARRADDDRLWARFRAAQDRFFEARHADSDRLDAEFERNAEAKQALLDEYDGRIDPGNGLDRARGLLRELEEKWDGIGFVPRGRVAEFDRKLGDIEARVTDYADARWRATDPEVQARVDQFRAKVSDLRTAAESAEEAGKSAKAAELREQADQWAEWADAAAAATTD